MRFRKPHPSKKRSSADSIDAPTAIPDGPANAGPFFIPVYAPTAKKGAQWKIFRTHWSNTAAIAQDPTKAKIEEVASTADKQKAFAICRFLNEVAQHRTILQFGLPPLPTCNSSNTSNAGTATPSDGSPAKPSKFTSNGDA